MTSGGLKRLPEAPDNRRGGAWETLIMRIAQVCPLYESCPPRLYGGTERIVYYLTEELIQRSVTR